MPRRYTDEERDAFVRTNWGKMTRLEMATKLGCGVTTIGYIKQSLGLPDVKRSDRLKMKIEPLKDRVRTKLLKQKHGLTVDGLSDFFDSGVGKIRAVLSELAEEGLNISVLDEGVELSKILPTEKRTVIDVSKFKHRHFKFGLTADNHLGSKYERMDVLNALFDIWKADGVKEVYQCGNMIEGERHSKFDIHTYGMQNQVDYFVENWPKREGIRTFFVTGDDHEGWYVQDEGVNIGKFIQMTAEKAGRQDLIYMGHMEHDVVFPGSKQDAVMRIIHAGGGSSYATSYSVQKIIESYQGGEKPHILLVGHYHKAEYGYPREVHVVQAGCTKDQDSFLRKNKIQVHVGGWTFEFDQSEEGTIHNFKLTWHPFFDKGFYKGKTPWQYKWK